MHFGAPESKSALTGHDRPRITHGGNPIYAIVRAGGRQYRVESSQILDVDRLPANVGDTVDLGVLMLGGDGETHIGTPLVDGARVVAEVIQHLRGEKILVFKYKNKVRYRRRHGHRQDYTRLSIKEIVTSGGSVSSVERPRRRRVEVKVDADEEKPVTEATSEAPEAAPAPRRRRAARAEEAEPTVEAEAPEAEASTERPARRTRVRKAEPEGEAPAESAKPGRRSRATKPAADAEGEGE